MSDEIEIITINLPTYNLSFPLSRETSALIWDAVKRGEGSSAEEYVNRKLYQYVLKLRADEAQQERSNK